MSVLASLKLGFASRGGSQLASQVPAKVTLVSWPSFAVWMVERQRQSEKEEIKLTHVWSNENPLGDRASSNVCIE